MPLLYRRVFRLGPVCDGSLILSTEILNCKFQSAQLDGVSSAEFVVLDVFIGRFEIPNHDEHSVALVLRASFLLETKSIISNIKLA